MSSRELNPFQNRGQRYYICKYLTHIVATFLAQMYMRRVFSGDLFLCMYSNHYNINSIAVPSVWKNRKFLVMNFADTAGAEGRKKFNIQYTRQ